MGEKLLLGLDGISSKAVLLSGAANELKEEVIEDGLVGIFSALLLPRSEDEDKTLVQGVIS
jgi:hypothetical protein